MPPLERENDTYRDFFSRENCLSLCDTDSDLQLMNGFANTIPHLIDNEIEQMALTGQIHRGAEEEDLELIPLIAESLKKIVSDFENSPQIKRELRRRFPTFKEERTNSVKKLREIAQNINLDKRNCNISTTVGTATGIGGGLLLAAGAVATFLTGGAAAALVIPGLAATALGSGTTFGTSIAEISRKKGYVDEAQQVVNEDKIKFQQFSNVLERSLASQEIIRNLLDINLLKQTIEDIGTVVRGTIDFRSKIFDMRDKIRMFVNTIMTTVMDIGQTTFWVTSLSLVVGFVFALVSIQSRNRLLYETGMTILKLGFAIVRLLDIGVDACTAGLAAIRAGGAMVARSVGQAAVHGTLAVVGIGLDVTTLILTSIDIHKGSISETATKINEAADELERELNILQNIHDEMN